MKLVHVDHDDVLLPPLPNTIQTDDEMLPELPIACIQHDDILPPLPTAMTDDDEFPELPVTLNGRYKFIENQRYLLHKGRYHATYYGVDMLTNQYIVIKKNHTNYLHEDVYLEWEYRKYKMMSHAPGIPHIHYYGEIDNYNHVVMDIYDCNLN